MNDALVSVVITTRNEEAHIGNCLESIKRQSYQNTETLVIDNASTDKTKEIAREYTDHVFDKGPERSAQRNYGMIEKANGDYVLFLDADMILARNLIERAVARFNESDVAALYIPELIIGSSFICKVRRFERSFYDGTSIDCVRFVKKSVLTEVGGFDLTMTGPEDWDFDKRIRAKHRAEVLDGYNFSPLHGQLSARSLPDEGTVDYLQTLTKSPVIFHNESVFNMSSYLKKKRYYAGSFDSYKSKWPEDDPDIRKQFGFAYRFLTVFLERGQAGRLFSHPILALGMYYLRFRVGCQYLASRKKGA